MADISSPSAAPRTGRALTFLAHRWPTLAGLAAAAFSVMDDQDGRNQGLVVFLAALIYLGTAVVDRPGVVWILFGACVAGVLVVEVIGAELWPVLVGGAVSVIVLSLVSGLPSRPRLAAVQIPLMLVCGAAALVALALDPVLGTWLVAVALIGHAVQDVIVWRANKVVARSLAEFCFVLDFTLGIAIIVLLFV
ncbi:hypothetical protein HD597_011117 [Nonomuraea thailandensis]|uniref:Uncharacterized protein n=1 Tax=Nonomuraea thailandensis TaxID=1188745 RepID=A0A9X2GUP5_9ACTN|nr:hypothetical protein [Nonomuraea thailandensis]MCP2364097.1 hypothetical protein [Nonomuraea thailandensis]